MTKRTCSDGFTRPSIERGFTLLELTVALGLGAIVTLSLFTLTAGSGRIFHEQQRVAHTQLALRNAVERVRGDIARAGYLATPHSTQDPQVCPPGFTCPNPSFQAIALTNGVGLTILPAVNTIPRPDQLDLFGAFDDANVYFSQTVDNGLITLDPNTVSYQQRFGTAPAGNVPDLIAESFFDAANPLGKVVRIRCPGERVVFQATTGAAIGGGGSVEINYAAWRGVGPYQPSGMGIRCEISSASFVRYTIANVCAAFPDTCTAPDELAGGATPKTDLIRVDLDREGAPVAGRTRIVAEYAVDFDVRFAVDQAAVPLPGQVSTPQTCTSTYAGAAAWATDGAASLGGRVRAVEFRLGVRTRDEEPTFPWVAPGGIAGVDPVVQRYELNVVRDGAARVRSMRTRVEATSLGAAHVQRPAIGAAACTVP